MPCKNLSTAPPYPHFEYRNIPGKYDFANSCEKGRFYPNALYNVLHFVTVQLATILPSKSFSSSRPLILLHNNLEPEVQFFFIDLAQNDNNILSQKRRFYQFWLRINCRIINFNYPFRLKQYRKLNLVRP